MRALLLYISAAVSVAGAAPPRNPIVRVVTISQEYLDRSNRDRLFDDTMERLNRAAAFRPDIAALPEVFLPGEPETVPGPVTRRLAEWKLSGLRFRRSWSEHVGYSEVPPRRSCFALIASLATFGT